MNPNNLHQMSSFNKHWENQGKTFSVSIYSVRRAQGCNSDTPTLHFWANITTLSRDPLTLSNFLLLRRPESRQILKVYMTNNSQDRSFHSFSDSKARSHRTEQKGRLWLSYCKFLMRDYLVFSAPERLDKEYVDEHYNVISLLTWNFNFLSLYRT